MVAHRTDNSPIRRTLSGIFGRQQADWHVGPSRSRNRMGMACVLLFLFSACVGGATRAVWIILTGLTVTAGLSGHGSAADEPEMAPADLDPVQPELSKEEWRQRIEDAKRRSKEVAQERREHPELSAPIPEDPEVIATERLLNDESLRNGDVVSTKRGLFVYRGRGDLPRRSEDFVPIPRR